MYFKKFVIFQAFAEKPPWTTLHQIWRSLRLPDVINCANFFGNRFRGLDYVGEEFCPSPLTLAVAVNTVLRYRAPVIDFEGFRQRPLYESQHMLYMLFMFGKVNFLLFLLRVAYIVVRYDTHDVIRGVIDAYHSISGGARVFAARGKRLCCRPL